MVFTPILPFSLRWQAIAVSDWGNPTRRIDKTKMLCQNKSDPSQWTSSDSHFDFNPDIRDIVST